MLGQIIVEAYFTVIFHALLCTHHEHTWANSDCIIQLCGVPNAAYDSQSKYYAQEDRANS